MVLDLAGKDNVLCKIALGDVPISLDRCPRLFRLSQIAEGRRQDYMGFEKIVPATDRFLCILGRLVAPPGAQMRERKLCQV